MISAICGYFYGSWGPTGRSEIACIVKSFGKKEPNMALPLVRNPPPTFRRHICQYRVPSNFICREVLVLYIETIWPAWIFELGLLKFSHFVSNSLRNVENDVQIFQF